jgi:hypothetical protein
MDKITDRMETLQVKTEIKVWPSSGLKMSSAYKKKLPNQKFLFLKM